LAFSPELKKSKAVISDDLRFLRAPEVGIEPTTNRLTGDRSTAELLRNIILFLKNIPIVAKINLVAIFGLEFSKNKIDYM
jgi:hypothetical protein